MLKLFPPDLLSTAALNPGDGVIFFIFLAAILVLPALVVVLYRLMVRQFCSLPEDVAFLQHLRSWRKTPFFF